MPSWAPGVYRPATADPSAVKSAFLFDKRSRCDPISVQQMPRFPVMLFPPLFFLPCLSLSHTFSLSLSFHSFFFKLHTSLSRPAWTTACNAPLAVLSQHHQSLCSATEACRPPAAKPTLAPMPHTSSNYSFHLLPLQAPYALFSLLPSLPLPLEDYCLTGPNIIFS